MRRLTLFLCSLLLTACTGVNELPSPGNYVVIPVTQTFEHPDFSYCSEGQCWNVQIQQATPTSEEFPVPTPLPTSDVPTPTPLQPVYICPSGDNVNVRQLATTSSPVLFVLQSGQRMLLASSLKFDWYEVVYKGTAVYIHKNYSKTCNEGTIIQ